MKTISKNKYELYNDDCLSKFKDIPDKSVDLVLIDPPYNIGKDTWDKWPTVEAYVEFMGQVFLECQRVLKDNGSFYFFHNDFLQIVELQNWINKNTYFIFKNMLVWEKYQTNKQYFGRNILMFVNNEQKRNYRNMSEYIFYYTFQDEAGLKKITNGLDNFITLRQYFKDYQEALGLTKKQIIEIIGQKADHCFRHSSSQWSLPTEETYEEIRKIPLKDDAFIIKEYEELRQEYEEQRYTFNVFDKDTTTTFLITPAKKEGHITPKPIELLEYLIKTSSNEGDIVLDCFSGSGTTAAACINTNRNFKGCELNSDYYNKSIERLKSMEGDFKIDTGNNPKLVWKRLNYKHNKRYRIKKAM